MEKKMSNNEFVNFVINNVKGGQFGYNIVTLTEPRMNKTNNPFWGRVKKLTLTTNVLLGASYEKACNKRSESDFVAEKPKGMHWFVNNLILQKDTDPNVFYLRMGYRPSATKVKVIYLLDNMIVKDEETMAAIKEWLPKARMSAKQSAAGIADDEQVIVRSPMFDSIVYFEQGNNGDIRYSNVGELSMGLIKSLFAA